MPKKIAGKIRELVNNSGKSLSKGTHTELQTKFKKFIWSSLQYAVYGIANWTNVQTCTHFNWTPMCEWFYNNAKLEIILLSSRSKKKKSFDLKKYEWDLVRVGNSLFCSFALLLFRSSLFCSSCSLQKERREWVAPSASLQSLFVNSNGRECCL